MKSLVGSAVFCAVTFATTFAYADAAGHVNWCKNNTSVPAQSEAMAAKAPDGNIRGPRSAADLYAKALAAKKAGSNGEAVNWLVLCQWHSPAAQNEILADTAGALSALN
ncbi:hypothetical protein ACXIT0_07025 [Methylorubrum extorquens]